jgi:predicted metal-dependent hydrolase
MATKEVEIPEIGLVKLYKRKGARSIRLSVDAQGSVRVSLPYWLPFEAGTRFVLSKASWIQEQQPKTVATLTHGQAIGKSHHLYFWGSLDVDKPNSRIVGSSIKITHPLTLTSDSQEVQKIAERACIRALRSQAESLLPQRLATLAQAHEYDYRSTTIKQLKGRWGSCDTEKNIVLNLFLMQVPWHLIDYVLLHELAHTRALHHGPEFWGEFEAHLPNARALRREMRTYRPVIGAQLASS